jgi:hypothetical protein
MQEDIIYKDDSRNVHATKILPFKMFLFYILYLLYNCFMFALTVYTYNWDAKHCCRADTSYAYTVKSALDTKGRSFRSVN